MIIGIEATHALKKNRTGVEEYSWQIIQHLKKTIPAQHNVVLYVNTSRENVCANDLLVDLPQHWQVEYLNWPLKKMWSQIRLGSYFIKNKPDLFFAPGQLIPFYSPRRTVTTIHDSAFIPFPNAYSFLGRCYLKIINKIVLAKSATIITPSEFSKNELIKYYRTEPEKIIVIPLGYNEKMYNTLPITSEVVFQVCLKYSITKPYILSIGRLEEKKNTVRIVETFSRLRVTHDMQLLLVGKPSVGYDSVKKAILQSPFRNEIKELGYLPEQDVAILLRQAGLFLFPSMYEGFGLPVLQAMASGCPVVASKGSCLEEVGGDAAIYADPFSVESIAHACTIFLENKIVKEKKIMLGKERAALFSWKKAAFQTCEIFLSLLSKE